MRNRIIYDDNGTLTDLTASLGNYHNNPSTVALKTTTDYLYIGSILPFNHIYLKFDVLNNSNADLNVEIWNGNGWQAAAEILDETATNGNTFGQNGFITWTPDKSKGWGRDDTNVNGTERITGLGNVTIYDKYWVRFSVTQNLTGTTAIQWVGNLFNNDDDIGSEFPDLLRSNTLTGFETGKTDWQEQSVRAAQIIINDLIDLNIIQDESQILERHQLMPASVMKTAEIVFSAFGDDFIDNRNDARKEYEKRIQKKIFTVDKDNDAIADRQEINSGQGKLIRGNDYVGNRFIGEF